MKTNPVIQYRKDYCPPEYWVNTIDLEFLLDDHATRVRATSTIIRYSETPADLFLHGLNMKLISIMVDGQNWTDFELTNDGMTLRSLPIECSLEIVTEIDPMGNRKLEGLYKSGDAFCTQCESEGFRRITYFLDRPDVLSRFSTTIIADKKKYPSLLSNGNKVHTKDLGNGLQSVKWIDPFPKPSYLFALVAGDFDCLCDTFRTKSGKDVTLEIYVDRGNVSKTTYALHSLKNAMKWDEERFGLEYDLDIYMIVAVDFFNMGAMENKGLNVFNAKYVLADNETATDIDFLNIEAVIGHEYFHNWTGNRVTCRDWFQLSQKEGLTVFRDQEFSSDLGSRAVNRIRQVRVMRNQQFSEDSSAMAHSIRPDQMIEMNNLYTITVYEKGAEVIRMLHTILGEEFFQAGMHRYFEKHDGSAATCDDFVDAMEYASSIDLSIFRRWYQQSGTPELTVTSQYDPLKKQLRLQLTQYTPPTADQQEKQALHIPVSVALYQKDGTRIPLLVARNTGTEILHLTQESQEYICENVNEEPILSVLRHFSAPVKLSYSYSDAELTFLMVHEEDLYSRWDASQHLLKKYILRAIESTSASEEIIFPSQIMDSYAQLLCNRGEDSALIAEILTFPSEGEIAEWFDCIDVDTIYSVRQKLMQHFAEHLEVPLIERYNELSILHEAHTHEAFADRSLRNRLLSYIARLPQGNDIVKQHFITAENMTDSIGALAVATILELPCAKELLAIFEHRWSKTPLVMDKWFAIQAEVASKTTLERVKELMNHPAFDFNNPNRLRSLLGSFSARNHFCFHAIDGSGYRFLADQIEKLNSTNPQVAASLITPLLKIKRYNHERKILMYRELKRLAELPDLSKDVYEKITKTLNTVTDLTTEE